MIINYEEFVNENFGSKSIESNQKMLRRYLKIIKNNYESGQTREDWNNYDISINYFTIIHNFLHLENKFKDVIKLSNKELNQYLDLPMLNNIEEVLKKFYELYESDHKVRFSVETLGSITEVKETIDSLRNYQFYDKIFTKIKFDRLAPI